jgi:hypothetical protein
MQRWLRYWQATRTKIRPTTLRSYQVHVEGIWVGSGSAS